jgi:RHS repeat-associated protein
VDILSPIAEARNSYSYSAAGQKLRVVQRYNPHYSTSPVIGSAVNTSALDVTKTTDYVGNKVFENNALKRILVDGGYIQDNTYYFYETDHLGSNRTVINLSGTVVERNDYYPYGMQMAHNDPAKGRPSIVFDRYTRTSLKFSGKELDVMHGLNMYDFSARSQDPTLGRFTTVDPKAEKYYSWSPYAYCGNNPIRLVDVNGKEWGIIVNANGTMTITLNTTISSGSNLNLTAAQLDAYKTRISTQLNSTISEASGGLISASISFDGAKDPSRFSFGIELTNENENLGGYIGGSTSVFLSATNAENMTEFGETAVHELMHTLTLSELAYTNLSDTKMAWKDGSYRTEMGTDKDIIKNVIVVR